MTITALFMCLSLFLGLGSLMNATPEEVNMTVSVATVSAKWLILLIRCEYRIIEMMG